MTTVDLEALRDAIEEWEKSFDLYWDASRRATERWRKANPGNDLVLPDTADLMVWLMDRIAELEEANRLLNDRVDWTVADNAKKAIALEDIANGMADPLPPLDDRDEFRYRMWQWSQKRARAALDGE